MTAEGFGEDEGVLVNWIRQYFLPTLDGIAAVHELGIVHRDIKPENVLLDGSIPKITDFGIAGGVHWKPLTRSHHVEGTIQYMAPEQFMEFGETDARGDVYALGKILYESIVGKMGRETACPLRGVCLPSPRTDLLKQIDLLVQKATAEDVTQRTASVKEFKEALELCLPSLQTDLMNKLDLLVEKASEEDRDQRIAAVKEVKEAIETALVESGEFLALAERPAPGWSRRHRKAIIASTVLLLVGELVGSYFFYHFLMVHDHPTPSRPVVVDNGPKPPLERAEGGPAAVTLEEHVPITIKDKDGCILHMIPEGEVTLTEDFGSKAGQVVKVESFYMYETPVTNLQYVEFLNQILPELRVEQGVVRRGNNILLMLGEVVKGYEPIIYREGKFALKDDVFALRPVLRVTGYGASVYAQFYGERLPTELEWLRLMKADSPSPQTVPADTSRSRSETWDWTEGWPGRDQQRPSVPNGTVGSSSSRENEPGVPSPVALLQPDSYGIRGLGKGIGEWGVRIMEDPSDPKLEPKYVILGGLKGNAVDAGGGLPVVARSPWEAFEEVGFRCALSVKTQRK